MEDPGIAPQCRLYLSGWPASASLDTIIAKIGTFGQVDDVALTERKRGGDESAETQVQFAHVTVSADAQAVARCIKALNGAAWGNSKLLVQRAKQGYKERILQEIRERNRQQDAKVATAAAAKLAAIGAIMDGGQEAEGEQEPAAKMITHLRIKNPDARGKRAISVDISKPSLKNKLRFGDSGDAAGSAARKPNAHAGEMLDGDDMSATNIRSILRQQGFLDSESDEETAEPAEPAAADVDSAVVDVHAEKDTTMGAVRSFHPGHEASVAPFSPSDSFPSRAPWAA